MGNDNRERQWIAAGRLVGYMVTLGVTWPHAGEGTNKAALRCTGYGCRGLGAIVKSLVCLFTGREERRRLGAIQRAGCLVSI